MNIILNFSVSALKRQVMPIFHAGFMPNYGFSAQFVYMIHV